MSEDKRKPFPDHGLTLFLDKTLYFKLIKCQADKQLGKSYAGLLIWINGAYKMGYLSQEEYEHYSARYTERQPVEKQTVEQEKENKRLEAKDKQFKGQLQQWAQHSRPEWRANCLAEAEKYKDKLESARQLLKLGREGAI